MIKRTIWCESQRRISTLYLSRGIKVNKVKMCWQREWPPIEMIVGRNNSENVRYHHKAEIRSMFMFALGFNLLWSWATLTRDRDRPEKKSVCYFSSLWRCYCQATWWLLIACIARHRWVVTVCIFLSYIYLYWVKIFWVRPVRVLRAFVTNQKLALETNGPIAAFDFCLTVSK